MKKKIVVMGAAGSGKSTIGERLAFKLGYRFLDGDDLHPAANREKMSAGIPLDDNNRWPWLEETGRQLRDTPNGIVIACSALKRAYRDRIRSLSPEVFFIHLHGERSCLEERLHSRRGHFFKAEMLDSQLAILEELAPDESGVRLDISLPPDEIIHTAILVANSFH